MVFEVHLCLCPDWTPLSNRHEVQNVSRLVRWGHRVPNYAKISASANLQKSSLVTCPFGFHRQFDGSIWIEHAFFISSVFSGSVTPDCPDLKAFLYARCQPLVQIGSFVNGEGEGGEASSFVIRSSRKTQICWSIHFEMIDLHTHDTRMTSPHREGRWRVCVWLVKSVAEKFIEPAHRAFIHVRFRPPILVASCDGEPSSLLLTFWWQPGVKFSSLLIIRQIQSWGQWAGLRNCSKCLWFYSVLQDRAALFFPLFCLELSRIWWSLKCCKRRAQGPSAMPFEASARPLKPLPFILWIILC